MSLRWSFRIAVSAAALIALAGCGEESTAPAPECTTTNIGACARLSVETRSTPCPSCIASLEDLATATEAATQVVVQQPYDPHALGPNEVYDPPRWHAPLARANDRESDVIKELHAGWPVAFASHDWLAGRGAAVFDARMKFELNDSALADVCLSQSRTTVWTAQQRMMDLREALLSLEANSMAVDPHGDPEPRMTLFAYARTATMLLFLTEPAQRRELADKAKAHIEARISTWETMQRERLKGGGDLQAALDAFGTPALRRLMTAWDAIEPLALPYPLIREL